MSVPFKIDLSGKVALVTGGGGVLCSGMAEALGECGANVAVLDLRKEAADKVANLITGKGGKAIGVACNVLERESIEEADRITKAQLARGAQLDSGNLLRRAKSMVPILVPLFVSAFRRADELALAMESRCYHGGQGRTRMRVLRFGLGDAVAVLVMAGLLTMILVANP